MKKRRGEQTEEESRVIHPDGTVLFEVNVQGRGPQSLRFRVPDLEDLAAVDCDLPLLPVEEKAEVKAVDKVKEDDDDGTAALQKILSDPKATVRFMKRANRMMALTSVEPKVVDGDPKGDELPARMIGSNDRIFIFLCLSGLAGFTEEAAVKVAPFVESESS